VVGESESNIGDPAANFNGFGNVPYFVKRSFVEGRGIFAGGDISKGTLLYDSSRSAHFKDEYSFRKFMLELDDASLVCDVLVWSYTIDFKDSWRIVTDLDEGSFCNNGRGEGNMGYLPVSFEQERPRKNGMRPFFALRDIKEGEEILCNYGEFIGGIYLNL